MPDMKIHGRDMNNHIMICTVPNQTKYIQKYIDRARQRKNIITAKIRARRAISSLLLQWESRKLERDARQLQQEADKGNLIPIWQYRRAIKGLRRQGRNYVLNTTDGGKTKTPLERQQRWAGWIKTQFSEPPPPPEQEIPRNMHITEQTWKTQEKKHKERHTKKYQRN